VTAPERHLDWPGSFNVRDLGGLPAAGGASVRRGALVRADSLARLEPAGWAALEAYGVRTVVDLRNDHEIEGDTAPRPERLQTVRVEHDAFEDREFWDVWETGPQFGTPLYYRPHLARHPERTAAAVAAIARAAPGGVAVHCVTGRDRTGMVAMTVLALLGVGPAEIAADYALTAERASRLYAARGEEDQGPLLAAYMREQGTTIEAAIAATLVDLDLEALLLGAGLEPGDLVALRERLLDVPA
jgi:protein-tyrosine phosphatase